LAARADCRRIHRRNRVSIGLFFCAALLPAGQLRSETGMGVLLSLAGAPMAIVTARLLRVGRFAR